MRRQHDGYFLPVLVHAMPRSIRLDVPGVPQNVIQRGNDRQPCFFADADYLRYRSDLHAIAMRQGCAAHAYVLMTNHVHLLVTPTTEGAIGRVMQYDALRFDQIRRSQYVERNPPAACIRRVGNTIELPAQSGKVTVALGVGQ